MGSVDGQDKISVVRRYFRLADQGRPDVLELFHEDAEIYFPKFGIGSGRSSLVDMVKGFEGVLEFIQHYKSCPLSIFIAFCEGEFRREPTLLGKAYWSAVLERI